MSEKGFFEKFAEIYIDEECNVRINHPTEIPRDKMIKILRNCVDVADDMLLQEMNRE